MDLYVIRHAEAVAYEDPAMGDDADRPLTETGVTQAKDLGLQMHRLAPDLGLIAFSPLARTLQTAQRMLETWSAPSPPMRSCDELLPGFKRRRLIRFLRDSETDKIALVGHQPDLGLFAAWLIGSKKAEIALAKGGVAYITIADEPGKCAGVLRWLVTPEWTLR